MVAVEGVKRSGTIRNLLNFYQNKKLFVRQTGKGILNHFFVIMEEKRHG